MLPTTVSVEMTSEAADRIAQLGIETEVDRMIEHAAKTVRGIRRIEISLEPVNEMYDEPYLSARAYRDLAFWSESNSDLNRFCTWKTENFSPDVLTRFNLFLRWDRPHAG